MIYLDSSAVVKPVREEPESVSLEAWLRGGLEGFVCYDRRLLDAAVAAGITVASPGIAM